jgi:hypothetical protein
MKRADYTLRSILFYDLFVIGQGYARLGLLSDNIHTHLYTLLHKKLLRCLSAGRFIF